MRAIAHANYTRNSPTKVAQVLTLIRKKPVPEAFKILRFTKKTVTKIIEDTLKSAVANAGRLKRMDGLYVSECYVGQGPSMKRWRARAFGRAAGYKHRTCHVTVAVSDTK